MLTWFRSLIDRVKLLLAMRAVQEMEAEVLAAGSARSDELRRLAAGCEAEGLTEVAAELRHKAVTLEREGGASPGLPGNHPDPITPPMLSPPATPGGRGRRSR